MRTLRYRNPRFVLVQVAGAVLGLLLGIWLTRVLVAPGVAIILVMICAVLALGTPLVKSLDAAFTKQIERTEALDPTRRAAFASYIMARRSEVHWSWLLVAGAAALGGIASGTTLASLVSELIRLDTRYQTWIFVAAFTVVGAAVLPFLRVLRYWRQLDQFSLEITELLEQDRRRRERLLRMKPPREFGALIS